MEITIKINGRFVSVEVSAEVADYLEQARRNSRKLYRERQRYWDGRECDEYIISTDTQRERFLLYALYDFSYMEIAEMCGCTKGSVQILYTVEKAVT